MEETVTNTFAGVDFGEYITTITGSIEPTEVLAIIGAVIGVGITFVLVWFGARKIYSMFISSVKGGRARV